MGILFIFLGLYILHMRGRDDLLAPIRRLKDRPTRLALLSAISTACYSIVDKSGVTIAGPLLYAFWLDIFAFFLLTPIVTRRE